MFPYKDDNPTLRTPIVTLALIGLNLAVWASVQGLGLTDDLARSICEKGLLPGALTGLVPTGSTFPVSATMVCRFDGTPDYTTLLWSMFMHGGWLHLLGNMWFLWVFGNNVEDSMGRLRFVVFYLLCGMVAAAAQIFTAPGSLVPMVGASGAIGGIMGAYIALYPRVKVHMMLFFGIFFWRVRVPAYLMLGVWAIAQVLGGVSVQTGQGGTAYMAHIGGFIAGVLLIWLFQDRALVEAHRRVNRGLYAESM